MIVKLPDEEIPETCDMCRFSTRNCFNKWVCILGKFKLDSLEIRSKSCPMEYKDETDQ